MGEEIAISLKNVSKCYKRYAHPVDRLKEILLPGKSRAEEFWALRDINLEVLKGETLGIIGQNGSGKSTLLQIIAGTLMPTTGEVQVNGRVSALLELGSGFNPEFTGRQNVFFNGQILGLSREEIEAKFDDIAAFAEIGDFIDQPVKTYSSGMVVRLAFAVVANTEPKILIVDEALAVGDAKFQLRCMKRIRQLKEQGVTILFVSHDSSSVKMLCQRAALMSHGRMLETGDPKEVVNHYIALLSSDKTEIDDIAKIASTEEYVNTEDINSTEKGNDFFTINQSSHSSEYREVNIDKIAAEEKSVDNKYPCSDEGNNNFVTRNQHIHRYRHGNQLAIIKDVKLKFLDNRQVDKLDTGSIFKIEVSLEASAEISDLVIGISIRNLMGLVLYGTNTRLMNVQLPSLDKDQELTVIFQAPCYFNKGVYTLTVGIHSEEGLSYDWIDDLVVFEVNNSDTCEGVVDLKSSIEVNLLSYIST